MANSIVVSGQLHVGRRLRLAHGGERRLGALVEVVAPPQREAPGEVGRGDQLAGAVGLGDRQRLGRQLQPPRRVRVGHEDGRQHAADAHLVAPLVVRELGDRPLHQVDELGIGGLADVEPDARQRHHPPLGDARRAASGRRSTGPRSAADADGGDRRRPVALRSCHVAAQQRQLGPVVRTDLVGDQGRHPLDPRRARPRRRRCRASAVRRPTRPPPATRARPATRPR